MNDRTTTHPIRIGTRGSQLALAQAFEVRDRLLAAHPHLTSEDFEIVPIVSRGDRIQDRSLAEIGGKGLFTEEFEAGLKDHSLDLAVHSMKDMPTVITDGLCIPCILPREDVRDGLISHKATSLKSLKPGMVVGTASVRRQAQIRRVRPDLHVKTFRGNVNTRLRKLEGGEAAATLLALAGLKRIGLEHLFTEILDDFLPAVAQGAIGVEARIGDERMARLLGAINDKPTELCINTERAMLAALDGSCRTPIAGLAALFDGRIRLRGEVLTPDGRLHYTAEREGPVSDAAALGYDAGEELLRKAGNSFFTS